MIGSHTQERATGRSAVTQLQMQGHDADKENTENDDDSDWLHRNDAYHLQPRHHQQTPDPIFPTMASGIILIMDFAFFNNDNILCLYSCEY
jgi:hypothetical protein